MPAPSGLNLTLSGVPTTDGKITLRLPDTALTALWPTSNPMFIMHLHIRLRSIGEKLTAGPLGVGECRYQEIDYKIDFVSIVLGAGVGCLTSAKATQSGVYSA